MPPAGGKSVTHVPGIPCYLSLRKNNKHLHKSYVARGFSPATHALAICPASPPIASFRIREATKAATPKSQLSDANDGACRRSAVRNGHSRQRVAIGRNVARGFQPSENAPRRIE